MKYLLDTNIIIDFFKGEEEIKRRIITDLRQGFGISSIGLTELYRGAYKSKKTKFNLKQIKDFIKLPEIKIFLFGNKEAMAGGKLISRLEQKGQKISAVDALIAATAKVNNLIILTEDKRHFGRLIDFGIKVEEV
ncbi:MAG: type II toxin-antitoxin system VapC family toxin [Patescibacteria group bacterium]|nr:type II toxin-antitoxin system VapC family toxin [Patescibacteria group bacterium]